MLENGNFIHENVSTDLSSTFRMLNIVIYMIMYDGVFTSFYYDGITPHTGCPCG